jgi:uncharacterized protein YpmB
MTFSIIGIILVLSILGFLAFKRAQKPKELTGKAASLEKTLLKAD